MKLTYYQLRSVHMEVALARERDTCARSKPIGYEQSRNEALIAR